MAGEFALKHFLRHAKNDLLKQYFSDGNRLDGIDWDALKETQVDPVFTALQSLTEEAAQKVEADFRVVHGLASERGVRTLIEEGLVHRIDLTKDIEPYSGLLNKALWAFLNHRELIRVSMLFDHADGLHGRTWRKRGGMPKKKPNTTEAGCEELANAISAYFREKQGRGKRCHVDTYYRGWQKNYFFAYPEDYVRDYIGYEDDGTFVRRLQSPAFEVIFVYDQQEGTLELFVQGDRSLKEDMEKLFGRTILNEEVREDDLTRPPYELNGLKRRDFPFKTDPADGISEVRVRELRLSIMGKASQRITFCASAGGARDEVYDLMERALDERKLPSSMVNVNSAVIQMRFANNTGRGRAEKTLAFRVSFPDGCSLKDSPEELIAKRCLKDWEIDRA